MFYSHDHVTDRAKPWEDGMGAERRGSREAGKRGSGEAGKWCGAPKYL